jgi:hypothetical protein
LVETDLTHVVDARERAVSAALGPQIIVGLCIVGVLYVLAGGAAESRSVDLLIVMGLLVLIGCLVQLGRDLRRGSRGAAYLCVGLGVVLALASASLWVSFLLGLIRSSTLAEVASCLLISVGCAYGGLRLVAGARALLRASRQATALLRGLPADSSDGSLVRHAIYAPGFSELKRLM